MTSLSRRDYLRATGLLAAGAVAGCAGTAHDKLRVAQKGVEHDDRSVLAWADIENPEHPTDGSTIAQVYLYITDGDGTIIGPDEMVAPPLEARVTRTTLRWYPPSPEMVSRATGVDVEIVGAYSRAFGSEDNGHDTVGDPADSGGDA